MVFDGCISTSYSPKKRSDSKHVSVSFCKLFNVMNSTSVCLFFQLYLIMHFSTFLSISDIN